MLQTRFYFCAIFSALVLWGAEGRRGVTLRGEISRDGERDLDRLMVELAAAGRVVEKATVGNDGGFLVRELAEGQYELRVTTLYGDVIHTQFLHVGELIGPVSIRLPGSPIRPRGAVSAAQLARRIPKKARQELAAAEKALRRGDNAEATRRIEKALRIAPDYMEAHNNLGVRLLHAGDVGGAIAEFRRALELDPAAARVHVNLALALASAGRLPEAAIAARRGLQLEPSNTAGLYVLGVAEVAAGRCTPEVANDLRKASESFPKARLTLARLLECRGETREAAAELQAYLESPRADQRPRVEEWIRRLTAGGR